MQCQGITLQKTRHLNFTWVGSKRQYHTRFNKEKNDSTRKNVSKNSELTEHHTSNPQSWGGFLESSWSLHIPTILARNLHHCESWLKALVSSCGMLGMQRVSPHTNLQHQTMSCGRSTHNLFFITSFHQQNTDSMYMMMSLIPTTLARESKHYSNTPQETSAEHFDSPTSLTCNTLNRRMHHQDINCAESEPKRLVILSQVLKRLLI